ncbi:MAG TPA: PQQ-dependent sugar dehydrogenase [Candidatus Acidoferrales bacterium]|nr:PQQ-dependent sugar dehydrogenase [Candidatus Acidoferrales bacterium]
MSCSHRKASRSVRIRFGLGLMAGFFLIHPAAKAQYPATYPSQSQVAKDGTAVLLEDYANPPLSNATHAGANIGTIDYKAQLGRITSLRAEPPNAPMAASRIFVNDQSGTLYILDTKTKKFTPYLKFTEIFPRFASDKGNASGIVSITFDPGYAKNGKFYTVHTENPELGGSATPVNTKLPSLNLAGYTTTDAVNPPAGPVHLESILVEWTDTNIRNDTFEGTAREILRTGYDRNHPMDDTIFDPLAKPGSPDYGNLYVGMGDGAQGETPGPSHTLPQQLNNFMGKILRITPDINLRPKDMLSPNGRYRIPSTGSDPNPFVKVAGARPEIYAYGLRHPHRFAWDSEAKTLLVIDIGLHYWEEIDVVSKGANYGYSEREGNEQLFVDDAGKTGSLENPPVAFPDRDLLRVDGLDEPVAPVYPAAVYSHMEGDSIGSGFVYRGKLMPQMRGKFIFNDMTTGRIFYTDLAEMIATHGQRDHQARIRELQIMYKSPYDASNQTAVKRRMFDIVADTYAHKGGTPAQDRVLPGAAGATTGWRDPDHKQPKTDPEGVPYGGGRADIRIAVGGDGEIYVLSKSDGMIRKMAAIVAPPPAAK